MQIEFAGSTHVGMRRPHNEDSFLLLPEERLFVVADGMGGHASGEVASRMAIEAIEDFFRTTAHDREITWPHPVDESRPREENRLVVGMGRANARIVERAAVDPACKGMGTTIVSLLVGDGAAWLCWAGDSRAYRFRDGALLQLSEDHSLLNELLKTKKLEPEAVAAFPHKNVIVRALGMREAVAVDIVQDEPRAGDLYLLCSDGLSGMVEDERIEQILQKAPNLECAVQQLIDSANAAGGTDNVTVVVARVA